MNIMKTLVLGLVAVLTLAGSLTMAEALIPQTPYTGVNTIGTVWQETRVGAVAGFPGYWSQYNYPFASRTGGFFGTSSAFISGLRRGVYAPVAPTILTSYYQTVCVFPQCYTGGAGFQRRTAGSGPIVMNPGR